MGISEAKKERKATKLVGTGQAHKKLLESLLPNSKTRVFSKFARGQVRLALGYPTSRKFPCDKVHSTSPHSPDLTAHPS